MRIFDRQELIATHERSYSKGEQIEEPQHLEALVEEKRSARQHRATDRLLSQVPTSQQILQAVAERGLPLRRATLHLQRLLELFGPRQLEAAIADAIERGSPHPQTVQWILEQTQPSASPRLPLTLPEDPRVKDLWVRHHSLDAYDQPAQEEDEE